MKFKQIPPLNCQQQKGSQPKHPQKPLVAYSVFSSLATSHDHRSQSVTYLPRRYLPRLESWPPMYRTLVANCPADLISLHIASVPRVMYKLSGQERLPPLCRNRSIRCHRAFRSLLRLVHYSSTSPWSCPWWHLRQLAPRRLSCPLLRWKTSTSGRMKHQYLLQLPTKVRALLCA